MTKERLKEYRILKLEAAQLEAELLELLNSSEVAGGALDGMPKGTDISDPTAKRAVKSVNLYALLNKKLLEINTRRQEIEKIIEKLEAVERVLMRERYINGKNWEEVSAFLNYGLAHTHRLHKRALRVISN